MGVSREEFEAFNSKERLIFWLLFCGGLFGFALLLPMAIMAMSSSNPLLLFMAFGLLFAGVCFSGVLSKKMYNERIAMEEEAERKQAEEKHRQWENLIKSGKWEFPSEKFYEVCKEANITHLDNAIYIKKAMTYAEDFFEDDVLKKYRNLYLTEEKVIKYFNQGLNIKNEKYVTPQDGVFEGNYLLFKSFVKYEGFEKRSAWLSNEIYRLQTRINKIEEGQEALHTLALATLESAYKKPTTDWATMGGIANGLAGPAAGLAVASDIMAENAKIEAENAVNQAYANNLATDFIKKSIEISPYDLKKQKEIFEKEKADIHYKVVLDGTDKNELFKSLKMTSRCYTVDNTTEIKVTFENSYNPDAPGPIKMVTDGTLNAKIFCDNIFVDEICVPLPMFGVRCKNEEKVEMTVYSPKYMLGASRNYRVEFTPNNLYVIER